MTKKDDAVKVIRAGNQAIGISSVGCYTFEIAGSSSMPTSGTLPYYQLNRAVSPTRIGEFNIIPMGPTNAYPDELRVILDEDNFLPKGLEKNFGLIWGQGPALYRKKFVDGKRVKEFIDHPDIQKWLNSWDYLGYLRKVTTDYTTINSCYTKFYRNRGARIGQKAVFSKLEHSGVAYSRLEWPDSNNEVHNIITGDFRQPYRMVLDNGVMQSKFSLRSFPVFNPEDPFAYPVSIFYSNLYNFALDYEYSRAPFHGALNWIKLASSIPKLLANYNINSAAIKWHVKVPVLYWKDQEKKLRDNCELENEEYDDKMLEDLKDKTFKKVTETLSGIDKAGKMVTTDTIWDEEAGEYIGWEFIALDQKVTDFISAQLDIAKEGSMQVSAGIGLPPSLSNLSKDGNLPSGAEKLYDFKIYLMTSIEVPQLIIMRAMNYALNAMFPNENVEMGFYYDIVLTEEATTPGDRLKNKGPNGPDPNPTQK